MALQQLTDEQIRTWTREQKDRWWLKNVYRGDMPQLTLRAALTGFLLGGVLSATNLYVGAKTGWTLGVGLTSVILAFAMFRVLSRGSARRDLTILENNCTQSIATAAGYMTVPLISGLAAYMLVDRTAVLPWWQMMAFNVVLSMLGVLVAFPMKRRFINDEQQPFPEGRACGVVLDTLYTAAAAIGHVQGQGAGAGGRASPAASASSRARTTCSWIQEQLAAASSRRGTCPTSLDAWYYALVDKGCAPLPKLAGIDIRQLGLRPTLDLAMFGAGGLMGIRTARACCSGACSTSWSSRRHDRARRDPAARRARSPRHGAVRPRAHRQQLVAVVGHHDDGRRLAGVPVRAARDLRRGVPQPDAAAGPQRGGSDVLQAHRAAAVVSLVGIPIVGALGVWMAHAWFGVPWLLGALAIPLIFVLALIAASSTALTSITPTGSLSKITQFTFGALDPTHPATNLMTGVMCVGGREQRLEPADGHQARLHARRQAAPAGDRPRDRHRRGRARRDAAVLPAVPGRLRRPACGTQSWPTRWSATSSASRPRCSGRASPSSSPRSSAAGGHAPAHALHRLVDDHRRLSRRWCMELLRMRTHNRFPLSPLAIGLGVVVPPDSTLHDVRWARCSSGRGPALRPQPGIAWATSCGCDRRSRSAPA